MKEKSSLFGEFKASRDSESR